MKIYPYDLIDEEVLNMEHHFQNDLGMDVSFSINYDPRLVVNMDFKGQGQSRTNAQGWLRDQSTYFIELLASHPDAFSERNIKLINEKRSPYCDDMFTEYFKVYKGYEGGRLVHHHIGRDGQAIALPQDLHVGTAGVHIAEVKVGIEDLTKDFSDKVQSDYINGIEFDWDSANEYYHKIAEERKILDEQSEYDQNNNKSENELCETKELNPELECLKNDSNVTEKGIRHSSMSDDPSTIKKTIDHESSSKATRGLNINNPESSKLLINIGKGIGLTSLAVGGIVFVAKNPEKVGKFISSVIDLFQKSKTPMKITEKVAGSGENNLLNSIGTLSTERASPIHHQVSGYVRKNGTNVKDYMRGKK